METWYLDVQIREKMLIDKEKFYEKLKDNNEKKLIKTEEKIDELHNENQTLQEEIKRLKQQLESSKEDKEELVELRNFAYNQNRKEIASCETTLDEMVETLNKKKIIVCGGHPNLQLKLKETIPNLETMDTDSLNKDFSFLKKYDVLFFYPNYANHSFYKKIKAAIKGSKTNFQYLPDIDNVEAIVLNMHEKI